MAKEAWVLTRDMFLDENEAARLLAHVRDSERSGEISAAVDRLIIEVLLFSGLRNSEFCKLKVADTVVGHRQPALRTVLNPREVRNVYVPRSVNRLIESFVRNIRPELLPEGVSANDTAQPLIFNERGRAYERTNLYRRVVRILTAAGFADRASVQLLRHTYGYLAYKRTRGNLLFVQRQLGHAHPMVTAIYEQFVEFSYSGLADDVDLAEEIAPQAKSVRKSRRSERELQ